MADVSIVIVNWNTRDLLAECLQSVFDHADDLNIEVFVVDNASADGSADMVRSVFPNVRLIANEDNRGFARANNQAIPVSEGRYVLLLNPDARLQPGTLSELARFMDEQPDAGAAGARMLNGDGSFYASCQPEPTLGRELWRLFHLDVVWPLASYAMGSWDTRQARPVDTVQGSCMLLRRVALDRVGFLDEDYFIYSEEVDLCRRLRRAGWRVWWIPAAAAVHHGAQSTRQVAAAMFLRLYQGKVLYFRKNHGSTAALLYKLILLLAAIPRLAAYPAALVGAAVHRPELLTIAARYGGLVRALPSL